MKLRAQLMLIISVSVVIAAGVISQRNAPTTDISHQALFPDLLQHINEVQAIEVKSKDGAVDIGRTKDQWVVKNLDDYPALVANVKRSLLQLAALKIIEEKTSKPEKYATLSVEDISSPQAGSRLVTVASTDGSPLVTLLVGKARSTKSLGKPGHYVRLANNATAYLVEGELELPATANDWIDTTVVNLPVDRVRQVTVHPHEGPAFTVSKASPEIQLFTLADVPKGKEVRARATVSSIGGILLDAKFEKVVATDKLSGLTPRARAVIETFDGLRGTVEAYDFADDVYFVLKFAHRPELVGPKDTAAKSPEKEVKLGNEGPTPTPPKTPEEVAKEVAELNARVAGWAFVLPDYKSRLLDKTLADLIKPKEPQANTGANSE